MPKFRIIDGDSENPETPIENCLCGHWMVRPEHFMGLSRDTENKAKLKAIIVFTDFYCVKCGEKRWTENHISGDIYQDKKYLID